MTKEETPYYGGFEMLTLSPSEVARLRMLIRDLFDLIENDDTGVSWELEEPALVAAEILKMRTPTEETESD